MRSTLMVCLALACAGGAARAATMPEDAAGNEKPVPMAVRAVGQYQGQMVVLLEDAAGARRLPIWIGELEARAIDMRMKKEKAPRPLTHDLLDATLAALGARIERVEVTELRADVFYGRLILRDQKGVTRTIDARPSDCIALAVGAGLPIFVAPSVLRAAAMAP